MIRWQMISKGTRGAPDDVTLLLYQIDTAMNKLYLFYSDVSSMTGSTLKNVALVLDGFT